MNKGWIVWIVLIVIIAAVAFAYTGLKLGTPTTKTTTSTHTTTVSATSTNTTSVTTTVPGTLIDCSSLFIKGVNPYSSVNETCQWKGGKLGIWVQSGFAYNTSLSVIGSDGKTYASGGFAYNAITFYSNVTLPAQNYTVSLSAGPEGGTGGAPIVKFNLTTSPPSMVYSYIYNANFSNGQYTGWNVGGSGFGSGPTNITYANSNAVNCYYGSPWSNYVGTYFASTYTCGLSVSPGNLTSEPFKVNPRTPFLNFRIVSPADSLIYVEVLQVGGNGSVVGRFNTLNISKGANISTTFANVSMPLTTLANKVVQIRVVAATVQRQRYMAIGDFALGNLPDNDNWVTAQINITG